ncbi:hypothetical protein ASG80_00190 [Agromyces sp. Soil535]|nr:hypothetical protein ASG80_00190 [Agromyces sp. Soil535]
MASVEGEGSLRISQRCDTKTTERTDPHWIEGQRILPQEDDAPFCDSAALEHRTEPSADRA